MKRVLMIVTTAVVLIAAASAYAAINTYTAKLGVSPSKAGTPKKPVSVGYTQDFQANGTNGNRTALIDDITTKIYGLQANTKGLPTCSLVQIATAKSDKVCPKGSELATGYLTAVVGSPTNFTPADTTAFACDPQLDVWNGGHGKLTFFFVDTAAHKCGPLSTGAVPPYPGFSKQEGKNLVVDVPIPSFVNRPVGLAGSLETEHLKWFNISKKIKGTTVDALASVGCKSGKRPFSVTFKATLPTTNVTESNTVSGKVSC